MLRSSVRMGFVLATAVACVGDRRERAVADSADQALYRAETPARCDRPASAARSQAQSGTVTIDNTTYPCRLYFRETGIVLRGDSAAGVPAPGQFVARDSRGRFFSSIVGETQRVAVWNADGSFHRTITAMGPGGRPVPRTTFAPVPYIDGEDRIYVRWGGGLWSVHEPSFEYLDRIGVPSAQARHANAVFRNGWVITSSGIRTEQLEYFRRYGVGGASPGFATIPLDVRHGTSFRGIVAADDSSFWAGSDPADDDGYTLERWTITGQRLTTLRREAPWFPDVDIAPETPARGAPPRPTVNPMNVDAEGLVLAYSLIVNDSWQPATGDTLRPPVTTDRNVHIEVLDPAGGTVLASEVVNISAYGRRAIPFEFFPRTRLGYRVGAGEVRIIEYGLTPK